MQLYIIMHPYVGTRWLNEFAKICSKQLKIIFCEEQFLQMWIHLTWTETNSYVILYKYVCWKLASWTLYLFPVYYIQKTVCWQFMICTVHMYVYIYKIYYMYTYLNICMYVQYTYSMYYTYIESVNRWTDFELIHGRINNNLIAGQFGPVGLVNCVQKWNVL